MRTWKDCLKARKTSETLKKMILSLKMTELRIGKKEKLIFDLLNADEKSFLIVDVCKFKAVDKIGPFIGRFHWSFLFLSLLGQLLNSLLFEHPLNYFLFLFLFLLQLFLINLFDFYHFYFQFFLGLLQLNNCIFLLDMDMIDFLLIVVTLFLIWIFDAFELT